MTNISYKLYISHRGNISGPNAETENTKKAIDYTLHKYDCEIDIWLVDRVFYLGHDSPKEKVDLQYLLDRQSSLWIHCKNVEALYALTEFDGLTCFFHDKDDCTLTSNGYIWTYPGKVLTPRSICVLPEWGMDSCDISNACGVCSDYIERYANGNR